MNASSAPTALAGRALAGRAFALAALVVALIAALASAAFALAAPSQAYADAIAAVGYQNKGGEAVSVRQCNTISEINSAIKEFSSKGEEGAYVEFLGDYKFGARDQIVVPEGKKANIYLAGHMIDGSACKAAGFVSSTSTLAISGSSAREANVSTKHVGYIDRTNSCGKLWKAGTNASKQEAVIEGGLLTGFRYNVVVSGTSDADITLKNLTIAGDTNSASVLINHWRCKLQLVNATIKWNFSNQGGAIEVGSEDYISRNNITLDHSMISENVGGDGGGICVWRAFQTTLALKNSSQVTRNYAAGQSGVVNSGNGGGIFFSTHSNPENSWRDDNAFSDTSSISISGGSEVSGNAAVRDGGGIYAKASYNDGTSVRGKRTIAMDGASKISGNQAARGGGVYLFYDERTSYPQYPYMEFQMRGASEVSRNTAQEGGGFYIEGSAWQQIALKDASHIDGNEATKNSGGGIFTSTRMIDVSMVGSSTINNNKAAQSGGGIFDSDKALTVSLDGGSQLNGNTASTAEGGAICTNFAASAKIELLNSSQISGNRALSRGGALCLLGLGGATIGYDETSDDYADEEPAAGAISNNALTSADGETCGGAIYSSASLTLRNVEVSHNNQDSKKSSGGGVYVDDSTATIINCSIANNKIGGANGGGVEVISHRSAARAVLGGKVVVRDNANGSGFASDVHIGEKSSSKEDVESDNNQLNNRISESSAVPITADSRIGLQNWTGTKASRHAMSVKGEKVAAQTASFFADDAAWGVVKINDAIWLQDNPGSYLLTVYAGSSSPAPASGMRGHGATVTLNSNDYIVNNVKPAYWIVEGFRGATEKLTPSDGTVSFVMPSNDVTVTAYYPSSTDDGELFDKLATSFPTTLVSHAAACKDKAVATAQYQLKNGTAKTADITWDFSGVDDTMTSGEFTVKGSFTDAAGTKHEVSQTFVLMSLNAPTASPDDVVYEQSQQVTLSLDGSFSGVEGAEIWYCVTGSDAKPAASDYKLYAGPFTVEKGGQKIVHAYAKVGQRQTGVSEFDYIFCARHAVKVNGGKAVGADGKTITSALEGEDVRIVADAPAEGKSFKAWTVTGAAATLEDATSAETTLSMGSGNVEITATYSTATYTVAFDTQGGSAVAAQTVEHGATATTPAAPTHADRAFKGWYADAACTQAFDFAQPVKGDTTAYAKWAGLVTVSFDAAGGSAVENKVIEQGAALGGLPDTARTGYVFVGWYKGNDKVLPSTTFAQSATLTAHWEPVKLSVEFLNGFDAFSSTTVDFGTTVAKPASNPVKAGCTFVGWCTDSSLSTQYNFNDPVRFSMKLFAKWQINAYAVTFDMGGGAAVPAQTVEHGAVATQPADPVRAGYAFKGWYADANFTTAFDFSKPVTANMTVYAKWAQLVTVSFDAAGGSQVASRQVEKGSALGELPATTRDDHVFAGWYAKDAKVSAQTTIDADTTLTARWDQNVYFVQYLDSDGDACLDVDTVAEGSRLARPANPVRAGYSFAGWYTDKGLTQPFDFDNAQVRSDLDLYAKWDIVRNQVTFDTQGGTAIEPRQVAYSDTVVEPDEPQRDGYVFEGWFTDAGCTVEYSFGEEVGEPLTLYAKWLEKVVITLDANGGSDAGNLVISKGEAVDAFPATERAGYFFDGWYEGDAPVVAGKTFDKSTTLVAHWSAQQMVVGFWDGDSVYDATIADYDSYLARPADPVRAGYAFAGWYTDKDCTEAYDFLNPVRSDLDLYAKWSINSYTVSFKGEGVEAAPQTVVYGDVAERPADPVRSGYAFKGWYADEACTTEYDFATPISGDTAVYAKWAQLVTVTFDAAGGSDVDAVQIEAGTALPELPKTSREGYVFNGWFADGEQVSLDTVFDKDVELTASWSKIDPCPSDPEATDPSDSSDGSDKPKAQDASKAQSSSSAKQAASSSSKQTVATSDAIAAGVAGLVAVAVVAAAGCGVAAWKRRRA